MNTDPSAAIRLFRMPLRQDPDVVLCRNRAKMTAERFGFERQDQIRIATAVSEIARNAFRYAKDGIAEFFLQSTGKTATKVSPQQLVFVISDRGPGIPNLNEVMSGQYQSRTGLGTGIMGAHRLMDAVDIQTSPDGTLVRLVKSLPRGKRVTTAEIQSAADSITGPGSRSPMEELASQNNEILFMLKEVGDKGVELAKVNDELSETNRGVVALYDELDTVYRVGHVLASKLELHDLLEAIINATTEISGAEAGMFIYQEPETDDGLSTGAQQHWAGPLADTLRMDSPPPPSRFLDNMSGVSELLRSDDLSNESRFISPFDHGLPLRSYLSIPVFNSPGALMGAMTFVHRQPGIFTERSERILASVALQASIGIENARLYKSVQSASAAKDQFLAILSHELRNPLNPVFMRLSLLEENPAMPADARENLRLIRQGLELETRLIDDLLDMTRIARGKISLKQEPVNLHEVVGAAAHACSGYASEQNIRIALRLEAPAFIVTGDAVRLQQVFWNLFNNAIKFSPPGGEVVVESELAENSRIRVTMRDTGKGITPGRMESIFQPFEQDHPGHHREFGGLGLGLAICKSIVDAHEGKITAQSEGPGQGACFTVFLPVTAAGSVSMPTMHSPATVTSPVPARPKGWRILVVDDHLDTRSALQNLLTRRGHEVSIAASCQEALTVAGREKPELLISDIGLPDGTGYDLMRSLRAAGNLKGIAVSGFGMNADIKKSQEAGFDTHITKPMRIEDLDEAMQNVMRGHPATAGAAGA